MGGGLMQLVAYGAQDIYLTGNPQITFFKVVYRRHTNFSMEAIEQTWSGGANSEEGRCQTTISRNGDLIHKMYIQVDMDTTQTPMVKLDLDNPGAYFIKNVEIEIGGQSIDKHTGLWMELWAELTEPNTSCMVGKTHTADTGSGTSFQFMTMSGGVSGQSVNNSANIAPGPLLIPLRFWFCRNPGLALPLIALQYHEVKVTLEHRLRFTFPGATQTLWVDYIYLDTDERRRFAQVSHEYLIEQLQYQSVSGTETSLRFNHPVKELVWCNNIKMNDDGTSGGGAFTQAVSCVDDGILLKLNGHDRFAQRKKQYFTRQQVYDYHSGAGGLEHNASKSGQGFLNDSIAVYSFALKPEEHQPSGTCNFSRIDNAQLTGLNADHTIFAVNYNVLRIMSGMGGLAYSN
jgi:hypothetical protein